VSYLLDTNVWVDFLRRGVDSPIVARFQALDSSEVLSCSVVQAELIYGALRSNNVEKNLSEVIKLLSKFQSVPFDDAAAERCGRLRSELDSAGKRIGPYDAMIAGIALANQMTLVTHNIDEFSRISGLVIEDWQAGG
jgi:tRNA(fMet)-specific endonuclease VapC